MAIVALHSSATAAKPDRPNVLFVVCDDLNTHVSPAGYAPIQTPALKRFAAESLTFRRSYCQYPVCGPSRASFLSGLYPETTGVLDNKIDIRLNTREVLLDAGYSADEIEALVDSGAAVVNDI